MFPDLARTWFRYRHAAACCIDHRDKLKPEVIWNIEKGLALTGDDIARAEAQRAVHLSKHERFPDTYDVLLCPATIVPPFPVEERYVKSCNGVEFSNLCGLAALWLAQLPWRLPGHFNSLRIYDSRFASGIADHRGQPAGGTVAVWRGLCRTGDGSGPRLIADRSAGCAMLRS